MPANILKNTLEANDGGARQEKHFQSGIQHPINQVGRGRMKTFSDMGVLQKCLLRAPFLRKLLADVFHQKPGLGDGLNHERETPRIYNTHPTTWRGRGPGCWGGRVQAMGRLGPLPHGLVQDSGL